MNIETKPQAITESESIARVSTVSPGSTVGTRAAYPPLGRPPVACEIVGHGAALTLIWADGGTRHLDAAFLWTHCPSAAGRRRRLDGLHHRVPPGLRLVRVDRIGRYAVNLGFSDGHDRGVYPWSLLAEFASKPTLDDFLMPDATNESPVDRFARNENPLTASPMTSERQPYGTGPDN